MKYIVFYSERKSEDIIMIKNMFENCVKIDISWSDFDYNNDIKIICDKLDNSEIKNVIFYGLELGWDKLIIFLKEKYNDITIKVINNTSESLLYYDYERNNFFKLLELSRKKIVDTIAFLKKCEYQLYKDLGYNCCYIMQNYKIQNTKINIQASDKNNINIGLFPLNYTWDKNIFNQLCIGKYIENSTVYFNNLDNRMQEFLDTMKIDNKPIKLEKINEKEIIEKIEEMSVVVSCNFTDYFNPIFFISMELGIPCLIGDTSDLFSDDDELKKYIVTQAEDNSIINSKLINNILNNRDKIMDLYEKWKKMYDIQSDLNIQKFVEE